MNEAINFLVIAGTFWVLQVDTNDIRPIALVNKGRFQGFSIFASAFSFAYSLSYLFTHFVYIP